MKHTPKPWKVYSDATKTFVASSSAGRIIAVGLYDESTDTPIEEINANARLIAAAPEMLESLEWILRFVPCHCRETHGDNDACPLSKAEYAIAKAKGE